MFRKHIISFLYVAAQHSPHSNFRPPSQKSKRSLVSSSRPEPTIFSVSLVGSPDVFIFQLAALLL